MIRLRYSLARDDPKPKPSKRRPAFRIVRRSWLRLSLLILLARDARTMVAGPQLGPCRKYCLVCEMIITSSDFHE